MVLRCTRKLLAIIGQPAGRTVALPPDPEDWYANLLWIDRRKNLMLTHAATLFTAFEANVSAAALRDTHRLIVTVLERELRSESLPIDAFGDLHAELPVITTTADRSVLGCMTDMTGLCEQVIQDTGGLARTDLAALNRALRRNINSARSYVPPIELTLARTAAQAQRQAYRQIIGGGGTGVVRKHVRAARGRRGTLQGGWLAAVTRPCSAKPSL